MPEVEDGKIRHGEKIGKRSPREIAMREDRIKLRIKCNKEETKGEKKADESVVFVYRVNEKAEKKQTEVKISKNDGRSKKPVKQIRVFRRSMEENKTRRNKRIDY